MGTDDRRVVAGLAAAAARAKPGSPNVLFIVLDDTGFGQLGCFGSPIRTPNLDRLAASGLRFNNMHTTALCSPSRSCMLTGPQPPLERDGVHHRGRDRLSRARTASSRSRTASCPRCCCRTATTRIALGKWHLTPTEQCSAGRPLRSLAARPRLRALLRLHGRRHAPVLPGPGLRQPPGRAAAHARGGLPPDRGSGRPRDRVHRRRQAGRARQAVLHVLLHRARCTRPTTCRASGPTSTRASSTTAGTPTGEKVFERQLELGIVPAGHAAVGARSRRRARGTASAADEKRLYARMMEVFAGFLEHTDHHIGRLLAFLETDGAARQHADHGRQRQRRQRRGRAARLGQREPVLQQRPRDAGGQPEGDRRAWAGPKYFNHYPWGWAWAGNTPFRRWKRETYRGGAADPFIVHWPAGIKAQGRGAQRSTRTSSTWCRRCWRRSASSRRPRSAASRSRRSRACRSPHAFGDAEGRDPPPHAVLRDDGPPRDLSRRLARGLPGAGAVVHRGGHGLRRDGDHRGEAARARREGLGAVPRRRGLLGDARTSPPSTATS